jgi:cobalt-zinc-cadmium efflux system protein
MVTLHAVICENEDSDQMVRNIKTQLKERFGLDHATIEIERGSCADAAPAKANA